MRGGVQTVFTNERITYAVRYFAMLTVERNRISLEV